MGLRVRRTGYLRAALGAVIGALLAAGLQLLALEYYRFPGIALSMGLTVLLPAAGCWILLRRGGEPAYASTSMVVGLAGVILADLPLAYTPVSAGIAALIARAMTSEFGTPTEDRRHLRGGVILAAVAIVAMSVLVGAVVFWMQNMVRTSWDHDRTWAMRLRDRTEDVVCASTMTETCAREAARRAGVDVAWIPDQTGFELVAVAVFPKDDSPGAPKLVLQKFVQTDGPAGVIEVGSGWDEQAGASSVMTVDGSSVRVSHSNDPGWDLATVWWNHGGHAYYLTADGGLFGGPAPEWRDIFPSVSYADP